MTKENDMFAEMSEFKKLLYHSDPKKRITITPLLSQEQISNGIVDLRLGTEFILTKKTRFSVLDVMDDKISGNIKKYQEKITINISDDLILHPNQFILGSTLEYIKLPNNFIGYVIGRSSWGRLGLVIATATLINSGFAGVITLELTNLGETPIKLYPGLRIAQISLHECKYKKDDLIKGKYFGSTSPYFSKAHKDTDFKLLEKSNN
jgi:dCTP deaminase